MMTKLTKTEEAAIERVIDLARKANDVGTTFGMTAKTTRLIEKLYRIYTEGK